MSCLRLRLRLRLPVALASCVFAASGALAGEWPQWGFDATRNMVSSEKGLPTKFEPGKPLPGSEEIDPKTSRGVRWVAKLGSETYGNPVVAGGRVFVGTNNESPRDPKIKGDRGVLLALDEATGKLLWQLVVPKLGTGKVNDWEFLGITASPTVDGDRLYVVTNRGEVLALDVAGMANGNDGPFKDEAQYEAGPGQPPVAIGDKTADIVWRYDMREELGVFPHNATSSSVLVIGDRLYVTTSNGVDWGHLNIPSPKAPALVVLDKKTGALLGEESSGISSRVFHSNWSSPAAGVLTPKGAEKGKERSLVVFGAGDGFCYAFLPDPKDDAEGLSVLKEVWRYDGNPPQYRVLDGKPVKYATPKGPSEFIATPVIWKNRVYAAIGQDPEHGSGIGNLSAIDADGHAIWTFADIGRSISTVALSDGLLFTADFDGRVYCLDAETGKLLWKHDLKSHIWGSPLVADGKMYIGSEDGFLTVFAARKEKKLLSAIDLHAPVYASAVVAGRTLFIGTQTHLYAVGPAAPPASAKSGASKASAK